jgi:flagellar motor switch/type III secretory pathway protein FliN
MTMDRRAELVDTATFPVAAEVACGVPRVSLADAGALATGQVFLLNQPEHNLVFALRLNGAEVARARLVSLQGRAAIQIVDLLADHA